MREVGEHDRELVAAEPGQRVALAQRAAEALGDDLEQLVAVVVPERVVDLLEAVEVDEQHRDRAVRAHALDRALDALVEERAVRQPGEGVVEGEVAQPPRRAGDDPEQHRVEQREADAEEQVERALLAADRGRHGVIGEVDLERAVDADAGAERQRGVDLEHLAPAAVVVDALLDLGDEPAPERLAQVVRGDVVPADQLAIVGVDEIAPRVEDLHALEPDRIEAGLPQVGVELREPQLRHRRPEVAGDEQRRDADLGGDARDLLGVGERAPLDLALQHGCEHQPEADDQHQREQAELAEERQAGAMDGHPR